MGTAGRIWWIFEHDGSAHFNVPKGKGTPGGEYKVCVLGLVYQDVIWPLLWRFATREVADLAFRPFRSAHSLNVIKCRASGYDIGYSVSSVGRCRYSVSSAWARSASRSSVSSTPAE
jgi:hypothetical protein